MTLTREEKNKRHVDSQRRHTQTPAGRAYMKQWYQEVGKMKEAVARVQVKTEILTHYGNGRLACVTCGESRLACLSIDHIDGGGVGHRKGLDKYGRYGYKFYIWLKRQGLPKGYQTLCMNCQFVKAALDRVKSKEMPK